jgi:hypothetical protein
VTEGEIGCGVALDVGGERQKATITLGDIDYVGAIADLLEAFVYDAAGT